MGLPWSNRKEKDMFKTIVLALDGSDGAKQAIPVATEHDVRGRHRRRSIPCSREGGS